MGEWLGRELGQTWVFGFLLLKEVGIIGSI